jgi:hypothetical protein
VDLGHLTANGNEDWTFVLELCEKASASEANAKEAVQTLRWEFKFAIYFSDFSLTLTKAVR